MLIGNYSVIAKQVSRNIGGQSQTDRSNWNRTGDMRNWGDKADGTNWDMIAIPQGTGPVTGWFLPVVGGDMVANRTAWCTVNATALGVMGFPIEGSADISIAVPNATAELVTFGTGSAEVELESTGTLSGSINGGGSASVSVSGNTSLLGAIASGGGASEFSLSAGASILPIDDTEQLSVGFAGVNLLATASILPMDDTPPARGASASFAVTGSLTPYAVGFMVGNALPYTELSPQSLAAAIWDKTATEHNLAGTMGNKLNTASSGGVDLSALSEAVWQYAVETGYSAEDIMRLMAATLVGDASGLEGTAPSFYAIDGSKARVSASHIDGVRIVTLDAT